MSVIIPTYKRNGPLKNCLLSILHQTLPPDEVIVVDNHPNPKTKTLVQTIQRQTSIKIRYVPERKKGPANARNQGIKHAKGSILAFIDDDCLADKNWLKEIYISFKRNADVKALLGKNLNGSPDNLFAAVEEYLTERFFYRYQYKTLKKDFSLVIDSKNCAIAKSVFLRRKIEFDSNFKLLEDVDLGFQLQQKKVDIVFNKKAQVSHYGKTNPFDSLKRFFNIGVATYLLQKKWSKKNIFFMRFLDKKQEFTLKDRPGKKSLLFKIKFYLLLFAALFLGKIGFYIKKVLSQ